MKLSNIVLVELCWPFLANSSHVPRTDKSAVSNLTSSAYSNGVSLLAEHEIQLDARSDRSKCTLKNLAIRREYGSLSREERLDYVNAVLCLQSLPPRTPANVSSGARSRFDDFTVVHIQQTLDIHFSGVFPPWHRWFVHSYEKALREECGYKGYQPYWDWPKYAHAPQDSPIFDGSDPSLGGNGEFIEHEGPVIQSPDGQTSLQLPPGVGSGNVTTGPFANMTINLGPVGGLNDTAPGPDGGLGYNPRSLKRDVGPALNERYANYSTVLSESFPDFIKQYSRTALLTRVQTFSRNPTSSNTVFCPRACLTRSRSDPTAASTMSLAATRAVTCSPHPQILRFGCITGRWTVCGLRGKRINIARPVSELSSSNSNHRFPGNCSTSAAVASKKAR